MSVELSRDYVVSISDCDASGRLRPSAILVAMQELAEVHAASFGLSRAHLIENGVVWVLYRQAAIMRAYPTWGEKVRLITWPGAIEGPIFPRHYRFEREDGTCLGEMVTSWILINVNTRRPMRPSALPGNVPANTEREAPFALPGMLRVLDAEPIMERTVCYSDLDVNGHMNNTRYLDWMCDAVDFERLHKSGLGSWQINYTSEAKPGEALVLLAKEEDGKTLIAGKRAADGRPVFESSLAYLA